MQFNSVESQLCERALINKLSPRRRRHNMPPPADGSSTRGGSTSVRGRVRSPHIFGSRRRWLSCRQPACLGQLRHGTYRQTDRRIAVLLDAPSRPYVGGGHNKHSVSVTGDRLTFFDHADSETFLKSAELTAIASSFVDDAAAA